MTRLESILLTAIRSGEIEPMEAAAIIGSVTLLDVETHKPNSPIGKLFAKNYGTASVEGLESLIGEQSEQAHHPCSLNQHRLAQIEAKYSTEIGATEMERQEAKKIVESLHL